MVSSDIIIFKYSILGQGLCTLVAGVISCIVLWGKLIHRYFCCFPSIFVLWQLLVAGLCLLRRSTGIIQHFTSTWHIHSWGFILCTTAHWLSVDIFCPSVLLSHVHLIYFLSLIFLRLSRANFLNIQIDHTSILCITLAFIAEAVLKVSLKWEQSKWAYLRMLLRRKILTIRSIYWAAGKKLTGLAYC